MPGKMKGSALKPHGASRKSSSSHRSRPANISTTSKNTGASGEADPSDEDSDSDRTPTKETAARKAPSTSKDMPPTPSTPTNSSTKLLAGLQLDGSRENADPSRRKKSKSAGTGNELRMMQQAIDKKVSELAKSGWRPEDEDAEGGDDDDDYDGVDLISHSDEEDGADGEQRMDRLEELEMAQENGTRRSSLSDGGSDAMEWNGFDDMDFAPGDAPPSFMNGGTSIFDFDDTPMPSFALDYDEGSPFPRETKNDENQRKVRFQDEVDGDGDVSDAGSFDSDEMAETYPDIFTDTPQFTPSFQRTDDMNNIDDNGSDAGSVWDFERDEMMLVEFDDDDDDEERDEDDESVGSSSGYDSDDGGNTTEEEEPCLPPSRRTPAVEASPKTTPSVAEAKTPTPAKIVLKTSSPSTSKKRVIKAKAAKLEDPEGTPRMPTAGTFDMDPRRAVLLVDGAGNNQRNTLYPARIQTPDERARWRKVCQAYNKRTSGPRTSVQLSASDFEMLMNGDLSQASMIIPQDIDLLAEAVGPEEAFFPFTSVDISGAVTEDTSMASASEDEPDLDEMSPFVNFELAYDDDENDEEDDEEEDSGETSDFFDPASSATRKRSNTFPSLSSPQMTRPVTPSTPSLSRQSTLTNNNDDLLSHLSRSKGLVHSFKMNQHYAKQYASHAADPSMRFSTSEMNAMQTGRRKAANTPITPLRRKRGGSLSKIAKGDWSRGGNVKRSGASAVGVPKRTGGGLFR